MIEALKPGTKVWHKAVGRSFIPNGIPGTILGVSDPAEYPGRYKVRWEGYSNTTTSDEDFWWSRPEAVSEYEI